MTRTILGAVGAMSLAAGAQAHTHSFQGGPFDGLRAEFPDNGDKPYFLAGLTYENPPSAVLREKIDAQLAEARKAYAASRAAKAKGKPGVRNGGETDEHFEGRLLSQCRALDYLEFAAAPFQSSASSPSVVRVSVVCGDRVSQFITFRFAGGVLVNTQIADAEVPTAFARAPG